MSKGSKQTLFKRRHTNRQETHEEMFNIANYQRNGNEKYNEISLSRSQKCHYQDIYTQEKPEWA